MAYTAYVLTEQSKEKLKQRFEPTYEKFIGDHITVQFGVEQDTQPPEPADTIKVIGYADSGDGLETLVAMVDGKLRRPDGKVYHITWSLDTGKYSPKDSNELLANRQFRLTAPVEIEATPKILI